MNTSGYNPYKGTRKKTREKRSFKLPKWTGGVKRWGIKLLIILFLAFAAFYVSLGELRFFANNFLSLGFFNKDYLIVLQNNYEARPTGGFVTAYGEISVTMGNPSEPAFFNSYEIDTEEYITPPFPHEDFLKNEWYEGYTFRDANWEPHFPQSADTLIQLYNKKFPEKEVDGMIVMNFSMIEDLLDELGGIELNDELLTKDNLFKKLTDAVNDVDRHDEVALIERKSVLAELAGPLMSKIKWHPFKTKRVIEKALAKKDMYLWFKGEGLQARAAKRGWTNELVAKEGADFLHVNLANLGSKKADRYLIKEVYHHVNIKKELPEVTTEITLRYPGEANIYSDNYKGYLRVYIPENATVQSDVLGASVKNELGFKVIGTEIILPAGGKSTISYTYQLPRTLLGNGQYDLRLVKQSGDNKRFTVTVDGPEDSGIESELFTSKENQALWQGMPESDLDLSLSLLPDETAPYPIEQVFDDLNTISIFWNESIREDSAGDALNYQVIDMDRIDAEVTDTVKVTYAELVGGNTVRLELEGVSDQKLERYQIIMTDIEDLSGNFITPNPKNITAVQRIKPTEVEAALNSATSLNGL